jgi:uncharacterized protein
MRYFDCTAAFGLFRSRVFRFARTSSDLLEQLDWCGIDQALVYHTAMRFDHPVFGNQLLLAEIREHPRLVPTWTTLPSATRELPETATFVDQMSERGVRALRLFPHDHRYFLDDISWKDQMDEYAQRRIPIFIRDSLDRIAQFLRYFPNLVVVTGTQGSNPLDRYAWPLIERYENLYFETASYLVDGIIEAFVDRYGAHRLLFSSGFPDQAAGAAQLQLAHADIADSDREAIAHGNLTRILAETTLE